MGLLMEGDVELVQQYRTKDGRKFDTEDAAKRHAVSLNSSDEIGKFIEWWVAEVKYEEGGRGHNIAERAVRAYVGWKALRDQELEEEGLDPPATEELPHDNEETEPLWEETEVED